MIPVATREIQSGSSSNYKFYERIMWIFLIVFVLFSFAYTVFNLSIAESRKILITGVSFLALFGFTIHFLTVQENNQTLLKILDQPQIISVVAIVQIIESLLMIFLSLEQIKSHYLNKWRVFFQWLSAFPSVILLASLYFLQVYALLYIEGISFGMIAFGFSLGVAILLMTGVFLLKKIIREWEIRTELKMLISLVQILLAMFLPLIVFGTKTFESNEFIIEPMALIICFSIIAAFSLWGLIKYKLNIKTKLWERLITLFIG